VFPEETRIAALSVGFPKPDAWRKDALPEIEQVPPATLIERE
jgi:hypothetical protein